MMQDQRQDLQQVDQVIQQVHTDAGLPESANPAPPQNNPPGGTGQGNGGQGHQQGQANAQDIQAVKDLLTQDHQSATDLIAKLTAFDAAVKQAAGNQKALQDAQARFAPIEASLPVRNRGFFQGNSGPNGSGGASTVNNGNNSYSGNGGTGNGSRGNGVPRGTGGMPNLTQGVQARIDSYKAAVTKLDAAIAQLKTDLGQ